MQKKLSQWATEDPTKRFVDLYSLLCNETWLRAATHATLRNKGSETAGIDSMTKSNFLGDYDGNVACLQESLKAKTFEPVPVRRVYIPKSYSDKKRPLGIPVLFDRIVQEALRMVLEPIWEADFSIHSYGFRPNRSTYDAMTYIGKRLTGNGSTYQWVIEGDIASYFDTIPHRRLIKAVKKRVADRDIRNLLWKFLRAGVMYRGNLSDTLTGTPQGGVSSLPTKLPTFFFGIVITWIWVDPKHDIDFVTRDFHSLHQCPDEGAFARPVGGLQAVVEFGGKVLQPTNNQLQFALQGGLLRQRLALLLQPGEALAQAGNPGLKLGLIDEALRVTVDQPGQALASLADLVFDGGQRCVFGARLGLQAPPVFLRQSLRVGQQRTDCLAHRQVQHIGPYLRILTNPLTAKAIRVCAQAAIIGVGAWLAFPSTRAEALPVEGIATVLALEQALQEIAGAPARLPGMALVLPQLVLDGREHRGLHERRDRDRDPVLRGNITDGDGPARLHGPMALGSQPGPQGLQAGLAKRRGSLIGRILQEVLYDIPILDGFAGT